MIKYVALLRGINVGGNRVIKMEVLRQIFESLGLANVRSYIQSGNVVFESRQKNVAALTTKIEKGLEKALGYDVSVILTTVAELQAIVKLNPFKGVNVGKDEMLFVTFLSAKSPPVPKLPATSFSETLDLIAAQNRMAFMLARRKKNGMFDFPNNFIEKQFKAAGTTRNWSVVQKIVDFAERE